jgi:hypothetical protein
MSNWQAESRAGTYTTDRPTGWAAYLVFAGVMLGLVGLFHVLAGLTALFQDDAYAVRPSGLVVSVSYTTWGWAHLLLGVLAIVAAGLLLRGNPVGRVAAVAIAAVSAVSNFAFVSANPVWAVTAITFDVLVIYAVCVHGGELRTNR